MMRNYSDLITKDRLRASEREELPLSVEYESNKSRILFCAPFRRLQQKAQVFSLEPNAAVRSRLTHSLEAAYIGRFISGMTDDYALETYQLLSGIRVR